MAKAWGVDYAWDRPTANELAARGARFAVRYLSWRPNGKNLTRQEAESLWAQGIATVLVWETSIEAPLRGRVGGRIDAQAAADMARDLGAPADVVIYFAVDFNPTTAQLSTINAYFDGVCEIIPFARVGVYGGLRTITTAKSQGWARFLWQTYAWSGGVWHASAHARQYLNGQRLGSGTVDFNWAMVDYIGQWNGQGAVPDWEDWTVTPEQLLEFAYAGEGSDGKPLRVADWLRQGMEAKRAVERVEVSLKTLTEMVQGRGDAPPALTDADLDRIVSRLRLTVAQDLALAGAAIAQGKGDAGDGSPAPGD